MKNKKGNTLDMLSDMFVTLTPAARPAFNKMFEYLNNNPNFLSKDAQIQFANRFTNFYVTYLLHVFPISQGERVSSINNYYEKLLFGNESMANILAKYKKLEGFTDNPAIKELFTNISTDRNNTDNIRLMNSKLNIYETNLMSDAIENLYDYAEQNGDNELKKFVQRLAIFSLIQSGVQQSTISYSKILPARIYSEITRQIIDSFVENQSDETLKSFIDEFVNPDVIWDQFHRNNWNNTSIVPKARNLKPGSVKTIDAGRNFKLTKADYFTTFEYKPEFLSKKNKKKKEEYIAANLWDELGENVLYKKVKMYNSDGEDITNEQKSVIFERISKLGNTQYWTEVYKHNTNKSLMSRNNITEEVDTTQLKKELYEDPYMGVSNNDILLNEEDVTYIPNEEADKDNFEDPLDESICPFPIS